jgi:hypothetical protein
MERTEMLKKVPVGAGVVAAACAALMLTGAGPARAADDGWVDYGEYDMEGSPDCGSALVGVYWDGAAGAAAGALAGPGGVLPGFVGGVYSGLKDVYNDCPALEPWMQNGT